MHHLTEKVTAQQGQAVYHNLPLQPTPLVGRGREVEALSSMLRRADVRLLTLIGPPGIGKTRLGLQVATDLLTDFPDGVCFVPLAPISDPDLVISGITQALELHGASNGSLLERLKSYLQSKQMLLLLDNFEQVVTAAPLLADLLAECPGVKVLVTSRELLHLYGEHDYPVPPLSLPDPNKLPDLEALAHYEAVALFMQRAQAVNPGFQLADHNAHAVAEICLRLDGLPLAIELAAARILVLPPEELLARLNSRLKLLTGGARNLPERQRTLLATIEWSYNLLDSGEQALFRRLGVFVGGCALNAIEEVCGNTDFGEPRIDTLDGVTSLTGKSLLQRQEGLAGEARFVMLETIREYTREKLEQAGELDSTGDRHCEYFLQLAERAEPELRGVNQTAWLERLAQEHDNMRAALLWAQQTGNSAIGLRLGGALSRFWYIRAYLSEGRKWLDDAIEHGGDAPAGLRAKALLGLSNLAGAQGDYEATLVYLKQALPLWQELGDKSGVAAVLNNLAGTARLQGEYASAIELYEQSLALRRELGQTWGIAKCLANMGMAEESRGNYERARRLCEEAITLQRALGDKYSLAGVLHTLGTVTALEGDYEAARAHLGEGLGLAREVGDRAGVARMLSALGGAVAEEGDYAMAHSLLSDSLRIRREFGSKRGIMLGLHSLAIVARAQSEPRRLVSLLAAAEALSKSIESPLTPHERELQERWLEFARTKLGLETFSAAWERGVAMPVDEAVALALQPPTTSDVEAIAYALEPSRVPTGSPTQAGITDITIERNPAYPDDLTEREVEVLRLIAAGKSNQEIALELTLSLRTVERHISNIYQKIGATGRVARATATAYALRHALIT